MTTQQALSRYMTQLGQSAKAAAKVLNGVNTQQKNTALLAIAEQLSAHKQNIIEKNSLDLQQGRDNQLDAALMDRLALDEARVDAMAQGLRQIANLPDPIGEISDMNYQPNGLHIGKMRVPLGVIGMIYESRPNVTADAAALCLKSGNAVILRGGSEAFHSNTAIAKCIAKGLSSAGLPSGCIQLVNTTDRAAVGHLITLSSFLDVIIPRGGKSLIERISREATIPVIKHLEGLCHVYIDAQAHDEKALAIAFNAKARRYGICGAMETLLVHQDKAQATLPPLIQQYQDKGIELRVCSRTRALANKYATLISATEQDWSTEYLAPILSIKIVDDLDAAIDHINRYGSHHTDAIITQDLAASTRFLREVDSSSVMANASTQFADGFEYGLGAEIGISTDKLHVRGPVGLVGLTCQKYIVYGDGHTRP